MNKRKNIFSQFADARRMIAYHAEWREFTGSVTATILLQQVNFLWDGNGQKAFYKFREPCEHKLYKSGDSWTEELGFSAKEFDSAIKRIGQKISNIRREKNPEIDHHTKPVEYWIDEQHLTWYQIHEKNFMAILATIYEVPETPNISEHSYLPKGEIGDLQNSNQEIDKTAIRRLTKGQSDLIAETAIRKSPKGESDLILQRERSEKEREQAEREEHPALSIFKKHFLTFKMKKGQEEEIIKRIKNMDAWEYTCSYWMLQEYQIKFANIFDFYETKAIPKITYTATPITPEPTHESEWNRVVANLQKRINAPSFNSWIRPCVAEPIGKNGHPVKVFVPDEVFVFWLGEHYYHVMQDAYETVCGRRPDIEFVINNENAEAC